jgi:uncharacterized membrane protein
MDTAENLGPIQMLTLAFPGNRFQGEILPELDRLKSEGVVRVIDMLIVRKDSQGKVMVATASDLDFGEATALGSYFGALAGFAAAGPAGFERGALAGAAELADGHVFDEDDIFRVTQALDPDTTAAMILLEHVWSRRLLDAVTRANGVELMNEWIAHEAVLTMGPGVTDAPEPAGGSDRGIDRGSTEDA